MFKIDSEDHLLRMIPSTLPTLLKSSIVLSDKEIRLLKYGELNARRKTKSLHLMDFVHLEVNEPMR